MATSPSLFGGSMSPQEMQAQLLNQRATQFAQLTPDQQLGSMAYKAGSGVGTGLAGAFGVQTQDPMIQRATRLRELAGQFNTNTAAGLRQMADALRTQDPDMALQLSQRAAAMDLEAAKLQSEQALAAQRGRERQSASLEEKTFVELAKKATPASVAAAQRAGNDISLLEIPENVKVSTYGQVLKDSGLKEGSPEFQAKMKAFAEAELKGTAQGRGTTITNVLPGVAKAGDVTGLRKDIQAITKPYQDQSDAAETAIEFANMSLKDNFASFAALRQSLAKAAGDTQISNKDVQAFGIDPSLVGTVSDTLKRLATGTPTADTVNKLKQVAMTLKKKADARIKLEEDQTIEVARASGQFTEEQLKLFRRRPAQAKGGNTRTTRSGVSYTVEND
jgi:hypothetical protein